jgi:hypothetical protein
MAFSMAVWEGVRFPGLASFFAMNQSIAPSGILASWCKGRFTLFR